MSRYRDELTAAQARAESLESTLEERQQEIAELESRLAAREETAAERESDAEPEPAPPPKRHRRRLVRLEGRSGVSPGALLALAGFAIVVVLLVALWATL